VVIESENLFGFIYDVPKPLAVKDEAMTSVRTLTQLMQLERHVPLNARISVSLVVAGAILELHTAGWLHKRIKGDKIVFIHDIGTAPRDALKQKPFLVGYEAARPCHKYGIAMSEAVNMSLEDRLYHHPECNVLDEGDRPTYRKQFDLYSLGCLQVEIALWQSLVATYQEVGKKNWPALLQEADLSGRNIQLPSLIDHIQRRELCDVVEHAVGCQRSRILK